jgi:S-sulfosulfanyl-L-cysteine sulfohydrolase
MAALERREFLNVLGAAAAAGFGFGRAGDAQAASPYNLPLAFKGAGVVSLLHMTDCHAQLKPLYFREPSVNLGIAGQQGRLPHLVGQHLARAAKLAPGSPEAYAFTSVDFERAAQRYGKVGGFAHLATLVKRIKAQRRGALLLDGGDTWQGSATALWTNGQDMVDACKLLGVDLMTGHWEFTLGAERVKQIVDGDLKAAGIEFLAQNVRTTDFGDEVFKPWVLREVNGVPVAIIGQAFPYTPIANPRYFTPDWSFGIRDDEMQKLVTEVREKHGAQAVVLLSHNGMDVDLKLATRVRGIDAILGGHTHDGMPLPVVVKNAGWQTIVTNAGSNGKFLGVLDLQVSNKRVMDFHYTLLPVFSRLLPADREMAALIDRVRAPHEAKLQEVLATTDGTLYRRGNFNGSWDQLLLDALMEVQGAPIAFSPGFRWGTSLLPGQAITREHLMDQTATSYSYATVNEMSGEQIKTVLEDVADNLFNPDPYYQQGGDMVRVGGLSYAIEPGATMGSRISELRLGNEPLEAGKTYKVAGWAPVAEATRSAGLKPVWDVVEPWLKAQQRIAPRRAAQPRLIGVQGNPGLVGS